MPVLVCQGISRLLLWQGSYSSPLISSSAGKSHAGLGSPIFLPALGNLCPRTKTPCWVMSQHWVALGGNTGRHALGWTLGHPRWYWGPSPVRSHREVCPALDTGAPQMMQFITSPGAWEVWPDSYQVVISIQGPIVSGGVHSEQLMQDHIGPASCETCRILPLCCQDWLTTSEWKCCVKG